MSFTQSINGAPSRTYAYFMNLAMVGAVVGPRDIRDVIVHVFSHPAPSISGGLQCKQVTYRKDKVVDKSGRVTRANPASANHGGERMQAATAPRSYLEVAQQALAQAQQPKSVNFSEPGLSAHERNLRRERFIRSKFSDMSKGQIKGVKADRKRFRELSRRERRRMRQQDRLIKAQRQRPADSTIDRLASLGTITLHKTGPVLYLDLKHPVDLDLRDELDALGFTVDEAADDYTLLYDWSSSEDEEPLLGADVSDSNSYDSLAYSYSSSGSDESSFTGSSGEESWSSGEESWTSESDFSSSESLLVSDSSYVSTDDSSFSEDSSWSSSPSFSDDSDGDDIQYTGFMWPGQNASSDSDEESSFDQDSDDNGYLSPEAQRLLDQADRWYLTKI